MKRLIFLGLLIFISGYSSAQQGPNFTVPSVVCVGQPVNITNTSTGAYESYYWSFCAASPFDLPSVDALSFTPNPFNQPVFIALAQEDDNYYAFIVNHNHPHPGYITRISFGDDILNPNPDVDNINGMLPAISEGIQIVEDNGKWYAFVVGGKTDPEGNNNPFFRRLDFGNSLSNTPTYTVLNTEGKLFFPHDLYIFKDEQTNDWWGMTVNNGLSSHPDTLDGSVTRFDFGENIENIPQVQNLGHFDRFRDPVGIFPIKEANKWHVFVTDRHAGLVRLDFGSSLINDPVATPVSTGGVLTRPRDISLVRYCDQIVGFVVDGEQHNTSHLVRLDFSNGLESPPSTEKLTELDNYFSFPHSISDLIRADDQTFALVTNVGMNNIVRVFFPSCEDEIPAQSYTSNVNPLPVVYNSPGTYNIELIVNSGLPDQDNICKEIIVNLPTAGFELVSDTICDGTPGLIKVHFTGHQPPFSFSYSNGQGTFEVTDISTNQFNLYVSPTSTTTYSITSVADNLCSGVAIGQAVTMHVLPKDDAGFTYPSATFCRNSPAVLPTVNLEGGTFSSSSGLALDSVTGQISPLASNEGSYYVTYTVNHVCENWSTVLINIADEVLANFSYSQSGYCQNDPNPDPIFGNFSFPGDFSSSPPGLSINPLSGVINPSISETGTYWVYNELSEGAGCPYEIDSAQVVIWHLPLPSFVADTACYGLPSTLTSTSSILSGYIAEYIWLLNEDTIGTGEQIEYIFPHDGTHTVKLICKSNFSCFSLIEGNVWVLRPPAIAPTFLYSENTFVCQDHSTDIILEIQGGSGDEIEWFINGCGLDNPMQVTTVTELIIPPPKETTTFFARWITNCNISECVSITITVSPLPEPYLQFDTVCYGIPTTFNDLSIVESGEITEWTWYFENDTLQGKDIQHVLSETGDNNVRLEIASNMGCISDTSFTVYVKALPEIDMTRRVPLDQLDLSAEGDTLFACVYNTVTLDAGLPEQPNRVFSWSVGAETDTITIGALGIGYELQYHQVTVTDTITGCTSTAYLFIEFSMAACEIGIEDPGMNYGISIYPNPAYDKLFIELREPIGEFVVEIYNIQGTLAGAKLFSSSANTEQYVIDVSEYRSGVYFVRLKSSKIIHTVKLIVSNP